MRLSPHKAVTEVSLPTQGYVVYYFQVLCKVLGLSSGSKKLVMAKDLQVWPDPKYRQASLLQRLQRILLLCESDAAYSFGLQVMFFKCNLWLLI